MIHGYHVSMSAQFSWDVCDLSMGNSSKIDISYAPDLPILVHSPQKSNRRIKSNYHVTYHAHRIPYY